MQTQNAHTHTHKNSICVISDVVFQNHILQQIEIGCVGKAEGLEDGHFVLVRILGPSACFLVCGVLNDGVRVGLVFKFYVLIAALKRLPATGHHFFFLHKSFMVTGHN